MPSGSRQVAALRWHAVEATARSLSATGSRARFKLSDIPGSRPCRASGTLRTCDDSPRPDCQRPQRETRLSSVVVGASFIGLEAAAALRTRRHRGSTSSPPQGYARSSAFIGPQLGGHRPEPRMTRTWRHAFHLRHTLSSPYGRRRSDHFGRPESSSSRGTSSSPALACVPHWRAGRATRGLRTDNGPRRSIESSADSASQAS